MQSRWPSCDWASAYSTRSAATAYLLHCIFVSHATTHAAVWWIRCDLHVFEVLPGIMQASSVGISGFDMFQSSQQSGDPCQFRLKGTFTTSSPACRLNLGSREATGKMEQNIDLERQISGVDNTELTGTSEYHGIWCEKLCYSESHDVKIYQKDKLLTWKDMFFFSGREVIPNARWLAPTWPLLEAN